MQLASEATVPAQEQEQKLADSSDNDDMETQEAELVLSTILHGRLGAHEEKRKEGQGAGDEDVRQLKEDAYAEEEGEECKDNSDVSRTHSRMERAAQAPGVRANTDDEGGEEGMGTSASTGVSAGKTGDMNVHEMMKIMNIQKSSKKYCAVQRLKETKTFIHKNKSNEKIAI
jgi:hypothetical protein